MDAHRRGIAPAACLMVAFPFDKPDLSEAHGTADPVIWGTLLQAGFEPLLGHL
jgi:hypothetical protein